jgi:CheY-like chemotaxis protein
LDIFLDLPTRVVLITTGEMKREAEAVTDRVAKIIYKPVNYTKTLGALEAVNGHGAEEEPAAHEEVKFENLKILVAEDNPINQKLIRTTLERFGADVTLASNGQEAFELRKQNDYDLIFMDIQMPVMNGLDATKEILHYEQVNHLKHIPIIALTANALAGDRERYIEAGMDNYIPKPINLADLRNLIEMYHPHKRKTSEPGPVSTPPLPKREKRPSKGTPVPVPERRVSGEDVLLYIHSPVLAKIYRKILEKQGWKVKSVSDERELVEALDRTPYRYALIAEENLEHDDSDCLLIDTMKEAGVTPFILTAGEEDHPCAETILRSKFPVESRQKLTH